MDRDWIDLELDRANWRTFVNTLMNCRIKRPEREAYPSSPSSADVKKDGTILLLRHGAVLISLSTGTTLPACPMADSNEQSVTGVCFETRVKRTWAKLISLNAKAGGAQVPLLCKV
jgi:hypothetical protein